MSDSARHRVGTSTESTPAIARTVNGISAGALVRPRCGVGARGGECGAGGALSELLTLLKPQVGGDPVKLANEHCEAEQ